MNRKFFRLSLPAVLMMCYIGAWAQVVESKFVDAASSLKFEITAVGDATMHVPVGTKTIYQNDDVRKTFGEGRDITEIKADAIAEIELAITGITDENIIAIATKAKNDINVATTKESIDSIKLLAVTKINALYHILIARQGIQNAEINSMINSAVNIISNATTTNKITDAHSEISTIIGLVQTGIQEGNAAGYERGKAEALGEMGEPCDDRPHIEVTKGDKTIKLYNPEKVKFIK